MVINATTWLEEEEIKVDTTLDTTKVDTTIDAPEVKVDTTTVDAPTFETPELGVIQDVKVPEIDTTIDIPEIEAPTVEPWAEIIIPWVTEELPTPDVVTEEPLWTWIEVVDTEIDKLRIEKEKDREDAFDSFNLARWTFEENKAFYTNFDDTNNVFEGVLADLRTVQEWLGVQDLTDEQLQIIANKNGVTLEEVKNPTSIFNKLELTKEWEDKFWVTSAEDQINTIETDFERQKEDLAFQLEWTITSLTNQIEDVQLQLKRNIDFATAQGAFTGGLQSSAFNQGIQNIKDDWETTINRLQDLLERVKSADATNVARLTEDYNNAIDTAKKSLDTQLETLKFDTWLQLSWLTEQFGIWSEELTNALNKINDEFWTKSLKVFNDYLTNMRTIQTITNENIIQQDKINTITETKANKRFTELTANNGLLLQNTSVSSLMNNVNRGELSLDKMKDLQNIMLSSITSTLGQTGVVSTADLTTIQSLMAQGKTPSEIVAQMQGLSKFKPTVKIDEPKITKIWDKSVVFNQETQQFEEVILPTKITPSWNITPVEFITPAWTKKTLNVDAVAQDSLSTVIESLQKEVEWWDKIIIWDTFRTREQQQALFDKFQAWTGWLAAAPWTSKHETWLAIDIYADNQFNPLTIEQTKAMNNAWWFQTAWEEDLWHFEYKWVPWVEKWLLTSDQEANKSVILSQIKAWKATATAITDFTETAIEEWWWDELSKAIDATGDIAQSEAFNVKIKEAWWDVLKIMEASAWGKKADQSFRTSFEKGITVISQLDSLSNQIFKWEDEIVKDEFGEDFDISPLTGWIRGKNPWDADAQVIESTLTSIVPNLARWVFGEVWVLTDQDVELYKKTIPNLKQTDEVKKAILALTLRTVKNSLDNKIQINAWTWVDMSWLTDFYSRITDKLNKLEGDIWITWTETVIDTTWTEEIASFDDIYDELINKRQP